MAGNDDLLSGLGYGPAAAASDALNTAAPLDPDKEARNRQVARTIGLPPATVRSAPDLAAVEATRQRFADAAAQSALRASPNASRWLANPDNAAVAHDDIPAITGLGQMLLGIVKRVATPNYFTGAMHDLSPHNIVRAAKSGLAQSAEGIAGVAERDFELEDQYGPLAWAERKVFGKSINGGLADFARRRRQLWENAAQSTQNDAKSPFGRDVLSGVQSIPGSLTAAGVTLATENPVAGAAVLGEVTGGQGYGEARDAGLTPEGAALKSFIDEGIETGTEVVPEAAMLKYAHGVNPVGHALLDVFAKEAGGEQLATLGQDFNQWAMVDANKGKTFDQYVSEIGPHALSTLTATLTTIGAMAGPGTIYRAIDRVSGRAATRDARAAEAETVAQHLKDMSDLATASKLRERDPVSFHDFVSQAAENGPVEAVYVSPEKLGEVLNQSELEPEQAQAVRSALAEPVRDALANGTDVRVPIEDFETHLAGTPAGSALIEHLKADPNGMSLAEAKDFMQTKGDDLRAEVEQALQEAKGDTAFRQSTDRVETAIADMLHAANRFTGHVNDSNATGMAAFYAAMAARMGQTPEELFAKYPIKVQAEGMGELDQGEPPAKVTADGAEYAVLPERRTVYRHGDPFLRFERRSDGVLAEYGSVYDDGVVTRYDRAGNDLPVSREFGDAMRAKANEQGTRRNGAPATHDAFEQRTGLNGRPILSIRKTNSEVANPAKTGQEGAESAQLFQGDMPHFAFFSPLERAITNVTLNKADGKQWLATISKLPGVKKEELEWTGLPEWLASRDGTFTRGEVLAFVKAGGVEVDEVELGNGQSRFDHNDFEYAYQISEVEIEDEQGDPLTVYELIGEDGETIGGQYLNYGEAEAAREDLDQQDATGTKFESYTEDGGEDYRELLLTLPEGVGGNPTESFRESGHFGDHPVIAHLRFKTRQTVDGKSVMFVEEVQSDWHQKGRDKGYRQKQNDQAQAQAVFNEAVAAHKAAQAALIDYAEKHGLLEKEWFGHRIAQMGTDDQASALAGYAVENGPEQLIALADAARAAYGHRIDAGGGLHRASSGIPDAPFKGNAWVALAVKRAIRWATDNGISQIAWTTGEQQRERYNLATSIGAIRVKSESDGSYSVKTDEGRVMGAINGRGLGNFNTYTNSVSMTPEQIAEVFGKDLGGRMTTLADQAGGQVAKLDGEDLKIGGEGMLGFYDRNLVNIANKIVKPHGAEVKMLAVQFGENTERGVYQTHLGHQEGGHWWFSAKDGSTSKPEYPTREAAEAALADHEARGTNPGFEITPELKAAAEQGFSLFQTNRGAYSPATDTITLLKSADLSTFLHESGHFYLEMLDRLAADPGAPQDIRDDFNAVLKWFDVKDAATWRAMSLEQKRASHEKWARGFEAYLFSGRAPSLKLQDLFQKFRGWLIAVYRKATAIGVQPTPAIRGVMDRMLATADEIAVAEQSRSMLPLFKDQEASGLDEHGWREYQRQATDATQGAIGDLEARSLRDMQWIANARSREINKLKRQSRAVRASVTRQVTAEIMAEPVYRAQEFLKRGNIDGQPVDGAHKLSIEAVDALYPDEATRTAIKAKLGYGAYGMLGTGDNAIAPEQAAELFGFTSADHLIRSLTEAESVKDKIAGAVEQKLLEDHGELIDEKQIEDAADKAIHTDARARIVATELAALNQLAGKPKTLSTAARSYAKEIVARLKVRNLKPSLYEAAAARAGKAAMDNLAKGNRHAAAAEKRNQLINVYASKEAIGAKEEVDQALAYFNRLMRPAAAKSIDREYLDQIETLLGKVDLRNQTLKAVDRKTSLAQWIEKQREIGLDPIVPDDLLDQLGQRSYKDLTVEELRGLRDAIKNIEHLGRLKNKLLTAKKDRDFSHAVGLLADGITQFAYKDVTEPLERRGWIAKAKEGVFDFITDHRKLASLAREMDGMHDGGSVWEYFIRPMNEAAANEAKMRSDAAAKLAEIFAPIGSFGTKQFIPEIGQSLSLEGRLGVALNTGNAINRERLVSGENWSPEQLTAVLSTLTAEQWGVVQRVWDFIGSYWPEIAAKEARVTGVVPERVDAEPIRVATADGHELELPGGYYPIKYNSRRSSRAAGHDLAETARQALRGAYAAATTRRGHTKARVESTGMQLRYDLGVVTQHVTEVIHDLTHHEMLIDTTRLLRASPVDGAIRAHYGPDVRDAFRKTIEAVAAGDIPAQDAFERGINYLRTGVTIAGLGWNLFTAMFQPLGLSQSVMRIGPKYVGKGIARWIGDAASFENTAKWISEQSPMMAERSRTLMREISEIRNTIDDKSKVRTAVEESFFYMIGKMQLVADIPTWLGQYEKSVDAGEEHDRAVALADQAVLDSQGGGQIKDLAAIQRGSPIKKLWTSFYSYFSVTYNLLAESANDTRRVGKSRLPLLAADFLLLTVVPNTLTVLMRAALHGQPPDPKDILGQNVAGLFNLMIGLREIGVLVGGGREAGPAGLFYGPFTELYKQVQQGEADEAFYRALNRAGGVLLHYPAGQVDRTVRGAEALADGQTSNPAALIVGPAVKQHR